MAVVAKQVLWSKKLNLSEINIKKIEGTRRTCDFYVMIHAPYQKSRHVNVPKNVATLKWSKYSKYEHMNKHHPFWKNCPQIQVGSTRLTCFLGGNLHNLKQESPGGFTLEEQSLNWSINFPF